MLNTILRSFMNEFLKSLNKGHSELKICLKWNSTCQLHYNEVGKGWKWEGVTKI
jgi:hypothetical protein